MLDRIIPKYLETHKRLVVPQLGAFIVKEPGLCVLFSELLTRDDGVLRRLLQEEGLRELEAAGEIDRFVFEVRHAVENGLEMHIEGLGVMKPGPEGTIAFVYEPLPSVVPCRGETETAAPCGEQVPADVPGDDRIPESVRRPKATITEPHVSPSVKLNPEPYVKGLRYGKPRKTTDSYAYVRREGRRADRFLIVAIVAAVIAVAAIAFGYIYGSRGEEQAPEQTVEQTDAPVASPAQTTKR